MYEYRYKILSNNNLHHQISNESSDGWELYSLRPVPRVSGKLDAIQTKAYFRRPVQTIGRLKKVIQALNRW